MSNGIEKFRLQEKIRLSYLKHAGNLELVSKECDIDYFYVKKVCEKFKKCQSRDVNIFIGSNITSYILMGAEERKAQLRGLLNEEINKPPIELSVCCYKPIKKIVWDNEHRAVCEKCEKDCQFTVEDIRDKNLILKLLKQLRDDDIMMVDSANKLGFSNKSDTPQVLHKETNYNLMFGGGKIDAEGQELIKKAEDLDSRSREQLRNNLTKEMKRIAAIETEAKFEDKK